GSFRDAAQKAIAAYGVAIERQPRAFPTSVLALDFAQAGPVEIAIIGDQGDERTKRLESVLADSFLAHRVIARHAGGTNRDAHPLRRGKTLVNGAPAVFICRNYACDLPVTEPEALKAKLAGPSAAAGSASSRN